MTIALRVLRFLAGVLLIPLCIAATLTVISLVRTAPPIIGEGIPPSAWALAGGFLFWLFLYFTMPRPARSYVLAHELTHALWGALMGAKVFGIKVSKESGCVRLSKTNFLIMLAPYFFPLYTVLIIVGYYVLSIFMEVEKYYICWLGFIGFTWGFHLTFTIATLMQQQSDIQKCGRLFSYAVIYLFNALGICLWIVIVSAATFEQMVEMTGMYMASIAAFVWNPCSRFFG
jgi:hypothetical protein